MKYNIENELNSAKDIFDFLEWLNSDADEELQEELNWVTPEEDKIFKKILTALLEYYGAKYRLLKRQKEVK